MVIDLCKSARIMEAEDGSPTMFDGSYCRAEGEIPPFNEYLNVNTPLIVGGLHRDRPDANNYRWKYVPVGKYFNGCIRNLIHNSKVLYL